MQLRKPHMTIQILDHLLEHKVVYCQSRSDL
nr:MAG TPA: hypothetical protein [Caudoviricetes sp.]